MELREYQRAAISRARAEIANQAGPRRSVVLVSPTGSGKTIIGAEIVRSAEGKGRKVVWVAHRTELVDQAAAAIGRLGISAGVISPSSQFRLNPSRPVQVASIQTLVSRAKTPPADLLVFDECHHAPATTFYDVLKRYPECSMVGLTATPERSDGKGLGGDLFKAMVVVSTPKEMLRQGHVVPVDLIRPDRKLKAGQVAQRPVDAWNQYAKGKPTIVFCSSIKDAEKVRDEFGDRAAIVSGKTGWRERRSSIESLRRREIDVITNVAVLTEGTDIPSTECIILARGSEHVGLYLQMIGRGVRPYEGKERCVVLDLRGISHTLGHPYDDREYSLDGEGISKPKEKDSQSYCEVCGSPKEPGESCPDCGHTRQESVLTVTGDKLSRYSHIQRWDDKKVISMLSTLLRKFKTKRQALIVFSKMAGRAASPSMIAEAERANGRIKNPSGHKERAEPGREGETFS